MQAPEHGLSSLIVTIAEDPELRAAALAALTQRADIELGELAGSWLPAVLESADPYGAFRELESIPGVVLVEVVFVGLDQPFTDPSTLPAYAS